MVVRHLVVCIGLYSLSACTPFIEYEHLSDPRIKHDGYDLICGGGEKEIVSVAICKNVHGGEFVKVNVRKTLD